MAEKKPAEDPKAVEQQPAEALEPGDAQAPGPITASHESGSWEQTLAEREKAKGDEEASEK